MGVAMVPEPSQVSPHSHLTLAAKGLVFTTVASLLKAAQAARFGR